MEDEELRQNSEKCQEILRFYFTNYFEPRRETLKEIIRSNNHFIDPDMLDLQVDDYVNNILEEAVDKFHTVASIVMDSFITLGEVKVREFEVLFLDLFKRTLLNDLNLMKKIEEHEEATRPIVIIADPNVKPEKLN